MNASSIWKSNLDLGFQAANAKTSASIIYSLRVEALALIPSLLPRCFYSNLK
jgi:hypothetical protein